MKIIAGLFVFLLIVWLLAALIFQRRLVYPRHLAPLPIASSPEERPGFTKLYRYLEPDDKDSFVEAWLYRPLAALDNPARPMKGLVIYAHGNGELIDDLGPVLSGPYTTNDFALLVIEYRGYGRSAGKPSKEAIVSDFEYFVQKLLEKEEFDKAPLIFHGRSLGGGVLAELSRKLVPEVFILESTFTSLADRALGFLLPSFLVLDPYEVDTALETLSPETSVLILHGGKDFIIPASHGKKLYSVAQKRGFSHLNLKIFTESGHNDLPIGDLAAYWAPLFSFLEDALSKD